MNCKFTIISIISDNSLHCSKLYTEKNKIVYFLEGLPNF